MLMRCKRGSVVLVLVLLQLALCSRVGVAQIRRPEPSALAKRAGAQLAFESTLEAALSRAKESGKRVCWYVPTLRRSPMDRKEVLDRYMRAGFFSDPVCVAALKDFVLLRRVPSREEEKRYGLAPLRFVEPGFLILDAEGEKQALEHGITTYSAEWFCDRLGVPLRSAEAGLPEAEKRILAALRAGDGEAALAIEGRSAHVRFLHGAARLQLGDWRGARELWERLSSERPEHAQAARAAAELEGLGPLMRGFWRYEALPEGWQEGLRGTQRPRARADLGMLRQRSLSFLLRMQREDGGFRDSNYDYGGLDSLPNVHVAVTALAGLALLEASLADLPAKGVSRAELEEAWRAALSYCLDDSHLAPEDEDEWIWARIYTLHFVARVLGLEEAPRGVPAVDALRKMAARYVGEVFVRQGRDGSFRHEYRNPFVTASFLLVLKELEGQQVPVPGASEAVAALARCRAESGAFSYGATPRGRRPRASVVAAAGRMPLCEAALLAWGASSAERVKQALAASFEHHEELELVRKYDDHAGRYRIGGFFYFYDQLGRILALRQLDGSPGELGKKAREWRAKLRAQILEIAEVDGTFVDSHELGRSYGTAMALLCLGARE
jgi:hypothetical protein